MASDISHIIKDSVTDTLNSLLGKTSSIDKPTLLEGEYSKSDQCISIEILFEYSSGKSTWIFLIPTITSANFEFLMLGGMGELKTKLDDEILDAIKEIISNIAGGFVTSSNAQGFDDFKGLKFNIVNSQIIESATLKEKKQMYNFPIDGIIDDTLDLMIVFDDTILPFVSEISGVVADAPAQAPNQPANSSATALGDQESKNLNLLYKIKLKLSVRLGTKIFLLKDILQWDIGEIIELDQMVSEPLDILVNGIKIGEGEAVIAEGRFGIKIKTISGEDSRMKHISLEN